MRRMRALLLLAALAGCAEETSQSFQLLLSETPIELVAPTEILVQVVVVGAEGKPVTLQSPNLPSFAMLDGLRIKLAPRIADAGAHAINLIAHTDDAMATGTLRLQVTRSNTGPMWLPVPRFTSGSSSQPPYAGMDAPVCDMEMDNFRFEIDVAAVDQPLDSVADYTVDVDFAVTPPLPFVMDNFCVELRIEFPGLAAGQYRGAVHAVDVLGAEDPYGWVELGGMFTVSP